MKRRIFPSDFSYYYPLGLQPCPMYVDVANRIYDYLMGVGLKLPDADDIKKEIAINVAIYFEDKMSRIGLWNAFVSKHIQMYHHPLPFFDDCDTLDMQDVNLKEVELLVWIVISRNYEDRFLNPLGLAKETAMYIMKFLLEDDDVEVNDALYDYIYSPITANDYFRLKHVLLWLRRSYLLCSSSSDDKVKDLMKSLPQHFNRSEVVYYAETMFSTLYESGPLALPAHQWLAEMYNNNSMVSEGDKLLNVKYCQQDVFIVSNADKEYATLKDSKGEEYMLRNVYPDLFYHGSYICTSLVKYADNDWEINGVILNTNQEHYNKVCEHKKELALSYERLYPLYMERTGGKRMAFLGSSNEIKEWLMKVMPETDIKEITPNLPHGSLVAFISKKAGIIFAPEIIHAVKCDDNPYYGNCDARQMQFETMNAVTNYNATHPELLHYLLENNMLQGGDLSNKDISEQGNKTFTQNINFIARNHRRLYYYDHDY